MPKDKTVFAGVDTAASVKRDIGYRESRECRGCLRFKELEDPQQDRAWIATCNLIGPLGLIIVSPTFYCDKWEAKNASR